MNELSAKRSDKDFEFKNSKMTRLDEFLTYRSYIGSAVGIVVGAGCRITFSHHALHHQQKVSFAEVLYFVSRCFSDVVISNFIF